MKSEPGHHPKPSAPPPLGHRLSELLTPLELPRLLVNLPRLAGAARGNGEAVMVIPGFGASDLHTAILRQFLKLKGFRVFGWGMGRNHGNVNGLVPKVAERIDTLSAQLGRPIHLVGWSLGGVLAREAARGRSDRVRQVITLATPVHGGPKYTVTAGRYRRRGVDLDALEADIAQRNSVPVGVPITAVTAPRDGVVAWQACIDDVDPGTTNVFANTTHFGMCLSPEVLTLLAERIANGPVTGNQAASTPC